MFTHFPIDDQQGCLPPTPCFSRQHSNKQAYSDTFDTDEHDRQFVEHMHNITQNTMIFIHSDCVRLNLCWQCMSFSISSHLHKHLVSFEFLFFGNKMRIRCTAVLLFIFLIISEVERLFLFLCAYLEFCFCDLSSHIICPFFYFPLLYLVDLYDFLVYFKPTC